MSYFLANIWLFYFQGDLNPVGCLGCIGIIAFIWFLAHFLNKDQKRIDEVRKNELNYAQEKYMKSLSELKSNPTDADLRQKTLELGRNYSNLTRHQQGVTLFDEVALMNDINAACAGAATISNHSNSSVLNETIERRLEKITELKAKGLIDEAEYASKRQKILDEV